MHGVDGISPLLNIAEMGVQERQVQGGVGVGTPRQVDERSAGDVDSLIRVREAIQDRYNCTELADMTRTLMPIPWR